CVVAYGGVRVPPTIRFNSTVLSVFGTGCKRRTANPSKRGRVQVCDRVQSVRSRDAGKPLGKTERDPKADGTTSQKHFEKEIDPWMHGNIIRCLLERTWCADRGVLNMHVVIFATAVAIVVGFAAPTCADDRPSDPFGNHTIELNKETPLVEIWESLRDQVLLDKAHFHSCIESNNQSNDTDC